MAAWDAMIVGGKREAEVLKVGFKLRMTTSRRLSGAVRHPTQGHLA